MNRTRGTYLAFLAVLLAPMAASAAPILYSSGAGAAQVESFEGLGQSFTAEDAFVEAGLFLYPANPNLPNSDPVLYQLFGGLGTGGSLLVSSQFSLATGFSGFYMVDFSSVTLTIGSTYSLVASIVGNSPYWGALRTGDAPDGTGILYGEPSTTRFALSVSPVEPETQTEPNPIPEPSTFALLCLGLVGMAARHRKKV